MKELAYVLITPYCLHKSRTGGIIARLLSSIDLDITAVKMYAPSDRMVDEYLRTIQRDSYSKIAKGLFSDYIDKNLRVTNPAKISNRCVLLLFEGSKAVESIRRAVGTISNTPRGDTLRGTYGDYVMHGNTVAYFEPAVIVAMNRDTARAQLKIFKKYAGGDGGVLMESIRAFTGQQEGETSLVMLKPDTLQRKSTAPGNIIDMFSRTGLFIIGARLVRFSIAQAEEFYAPLKALLEERLDKPLQDLVSRVFGPALPFPLEAEDLGAIVDRLRRGNARHEFYRIVEYITGLDPTKADHNRPGKESCLSLLYHGNNAITKIRKSLGSTDPQMAEGGTVRSIFGHDILRNGVHASDSVASAKRERRVVGLLGHEKSELDTVI
jgi:nucleoside diphosphate kinase